MRRGDVVGEVALFSRARAPPTSTSSRDARLLRFGDADLERLGRRYPRIAAQVYRNLNRVLAAARRHDRRGAALSGMRPWAHQPCLWRP